MTMTNKDWCRLDIQCSVMARKCSMVIYLFFIQIITLVVIIEIYYVSLEKLKLAKFLKL